MEFFRKPFLFVVGSVAILVDQAAKSIEEARKNFDEQREKLLKRPVKTEA